MRWIIIIMLIIQYPAHGQSVSLEQSRHIAGPANVRTAPDGELKMVLNDFTDVNISSEKGEWYYIGIGSFVNEEDVTKLNESGKDKFSGLLKKNSNLYDYKGKVIGIIKKELKFTSDIKVNGLLRTNIDGYTHKDNLRTTISKDGILESKEVMYFEVCNTKIFKREGRIIKEECNYGPKEKKELIEKYEKWKIKYYDDYGWPVEMMSDCNYVENKIELDGKMIDALIRIEKITMNPTGVEKNGPNSVYNLSIYSKEKEEIKLERVIKLYADNIKIEEKSIKLETYGFGGRDESTYKVVGF